MRRSSRVSRAIANALSKRNPLPSRLARMDAKKKYEAGLAEIVKACHTICGMGETDPSHIETCKKSCTSPAVADTSKR